MKRKVFLAAYAGILGVALMMQSCQDDPINPNTGDEGNGSDTTWVNNDSIYDNGDCPGCDSSSWSPDGDPNGGGDGGNDGNCPGCDSTSWSPDGGGNDGGSDDGNCPGCDSTSWSPDSTNIGG